MHGLSPEHLYIGASNTQTCNITNSYRPISMEADYTAGPPSVQRDTRPAKYMYHTFGVKITHFWLIRASCHIYEN